MAHSLRNALCARGRVFSGNGEGSRFVRLEWVRKQIAERLGFVPYPGTLNLKLVEQKVSLHNSLEEATRIEILPPKGYCRGICFQALFMNKVACAVVVPQVNNYPKDIVEIVAPMNLRRKLHLKDNDVVSVEILL